MTHATLWHNWTFLLTVCLLAGPGISTAQSTTLNLQDVDIEALIGTVSEITGKSFIVDPRVEGTVTVISKRSMNPDEIYDVFQSILKVHGFAAVPSGDFVKIVPDAAAHQDTIPAANGGALDDSLVTQVLQVSHVPAAELAQLLRPLIPQNAHIIAHSGSNVLVISDRAGNVDRIRKIISRIDTASEDDIEVIALQHANAAEVVRTLDLLSDGPAGQGGPKIVADDRTNTIMLAGDPGSRLRLRTILSHLDTPLESGSTQVIYLKYASADSLVGVLDKVSQSLEGGDARTTAHIQAHPETNSLIISAPPAVFRSLESIVRQLDIRRQQVMVEAIIAEVSNDLTKELGVQWQATGLNSTSESGVIGGTNFPTNQGSGPGLLGLSTTDGLTALGGLGSGLNLGYLAGTIRVQTGTDSSGAPIFSEVPQLAAIASALNADANTNVLSTPSIVTLDHQEALINVGQEVPFLTGQFTNTGANNSSVNPFQTINREDVGIKLTVTPHINAEGNLVVLEIVQEASSLAPQSGAVDLITNKREFATTVMVPDEGVLVLGGLIDETVQETVRKVPGLGDVPVLGHLFKYRSSNKVKRNLMVFIRPIILRDEASINSVTGSRYNSIREAQQRAREFNPGLLPDTELPLLPDLSEFKASRGVLQESDL